MTAPTPPSDAYKVIKVTRYACTCRRCGWSWQAVEPPIRCASCGAPGWWHPAGKKGWPKGVKRVKADTEK